MINIMKHLACLLASATITTTAHADSNAPTGAEIADRHTEVTGGMEAYDKLHNRVQHATLSMPAQNIEMGVTMYMAKPNLTYLIIEAPQNGTITKGTYEGEVWESSLMTGPALKEGAEKTDGLLNATFDRWVYWRTAFENVELVGESEVDGDACYDVEMTPDQGHPQTFSYSKETGLLLRITAVVDSQMGELEIDSYFKDYRNADGILLAHELRVQVMGQERVFKTKSYEHNANLPEDRFVPPAEIMALYPKNSPE